MADASRTVEIKFQSTADPAGAEQEVKIIDTVKAAGKSSNEEFAAWQAELTAARKGNISMTATQASMEEEAAVKHQAQAAARLQSDKLIEEAQLRRAAEAREAAAADAKEDLAKAERLQAQMLLEQQRADKFLASRATQLGLREAGVPDARIFRSVLFNEGALARIGTALTTTLAGPLALVAAGAGVAAMAVHKASEELDALTQHQEKLGIKSAELGAVAQTFVHPWETTKEIAGTVVDALGNILGLQKGLTSETIKTAEEHTQLAEKMMQELETEKALMVVRQKGHETDVIRAETASAKILNSELEKTLNISRAQNDLAAARERRAGMSAGQSAVNSVGRKEGEDAIELQKANQKVTDLETQLTREEETAAKLRASANYAAGMHSADAPQKEAAAESAEQKALATRTAAELAKSKLDETAKTLTIAITDESEKAMDTVAQGVATKDAETAQKTIADLEAKRAAQGGLSPIAQAVEDGLQKIADGANGSPEEQNKVVGLLRQLLTTQEGRDSAMATNIWTLITNQQNTITEIAHQKAELEKIRSAFEDYKRSYTR